MGGLMVILIIVIIVNLVIVIMVMVSQTHLLSLSEAENLSNCHHGIALPFSKWFQSGKKGAAHPKLCITCCHCHHGHGLPLLTVGFHVIIQMTKRIHPASDLRASRL